MELVETAKEFLESLKDVEDLSNNETVINSDALHKLISTVSFYADEDTLKALMCVVVDYKHSCTKSIAKEIIIEEKEGKTETSERRRKMIYDTRNLLCNAEIGFLIGIGSYRDLCEVELKKLKESCEEIDMSFEEAMQMIKDMRALKGFEEHKEAKAIILPVNNIGEA